VGGLELTTFRLLGMDNSHSAMHCIPMYEKMPLKVPSVESEMVMIMKFVNDSNDAFYVMKTISNAYG
jgi:hypothetical protein